MKKGFVIFIFLIATAFIFMNCSGKMENNEKTANKSEQRQIKDTNEKIASKSEQDQIKEVTWIGFNEGLEKALKEKKNVIVDFYTDWCGWCKVLDEKTFRDPAVAKKLSERFVTVRINAESTSESVHYKGRTFTNIELTRALRVTGFPSLGFFNSDGEIIALVPGFIPPERFVYILDYIDKECYKKQVSFEEFMKRKGEC